MECSTRSRGPLAAAILLSAMASASAMAQVPVAGHKVELHGFFSQGFMRSGGNNYMTMRTNRGAFDFTDAGFNASTNLTENFRVGAQAYVRNIGDLGNGRVTLDWATADYRFRDYLGFRAGRVKTVFGLYNDTQDLEFLHTWALLPQSLYPLDLRGLSISHLGGDVYGSISPRRLGTFSYTAYIGKGPPDPTGGRMHTFASYGLKLDRNEGKLAGADLKWTTPLKGLMLGGAYMNAPQTYEGSNLIFETPFRGGTTARNLVVSVQYTRGKLRLDFERNRLISITTIDGAFGTGGIVAELPYDSRGWYVAAAYRLRNHLELGSYHSRHAPNSGRQPPFMPYLPPAARHLNDQAVAARFDFKSHWDLKLEGHLMDGYGDPASSRGFYPQDNPQGMRHMTPLLVIRLGFNF